MSRRTLTDRQWAVIEPLVPDKPGDRGRTGVDNRLFVDAIRPLARTAAPWRNLPPELGNRKTVPSRFRRWTLPGVLEMLFRASSTDPDLDSVPVDATICKTRAGATSRKGGAEAAAIGRSKGGLTTKIHAAVDALGLPIRFTITPGQWGDSPQARGLIEGLSGDGHVITDTARDADHLRSFTADEPGAMAHVKPNPTRREDRSIDWVLYEKRHLAACFFNKLERFSDASP